MSFTNRSGKFDYAAFVGSLADNCNPGDILSPRCSRETYNHGNQDNLDTANKKLRFAFETRLANRSEFKRKRSDAGGYEYLRL
tara:strand:- start:33503 stop:33751 length:249 start_codon:yes stop_codon:yes gene_type:complete